MKKITMTIITLLILIGCVSNDTKTKDDIENSGIVLSEEDKKDIVTLDLNDYDRDFIAFIEQGMRNHDVININGDFLKISEIKKVQDRERVRLTLSFISPQGTFELVFNDEHDFISGTLFLNPEDKRYRSVHLIELSSLIEIIPLKITEEEKSYFISSYELHLIDLLFDWNPEQVSYSSEDYFDYIYYTIDFENYEFKILTI